MKDINLLVLLFIIFIRIHVVLFSHQTTGLKRYTKSGGFSRNTCLVCQSATYSNEYILVTHFLSFNSNLIIAILVTSKHNVFYLATETIFVRVYETRIDLLRAAIIGPEGSPYHDGLFLFDVWFPRIYPIYPPVCHALIVIILLFFIYLILMRHLGWLIQFIEWTFVLDCEISLWWSCYQSKYFKVWWSSLEAFQKN